MAKSNGQDRKRVSSQKHEIEYTSGKVAEQAGVAKPKAKKALKTAKKQLGRSTSRSKVEPRAKKLAAR